VRLFLVTFFILYGLLHLYAFLKAKSALSFSPKIGSLVIAFMAVMLFSPLIINYSERIGFEFFARIMSYIGYIWMGILFLFVSVSFLMDVYRLSIYFLELLSRRDLSVIMPSARFSFFVPFIFAFIVSAYGYFEARDIRVEHFSVKTSKIPKKINSLRIVQISDVHLGLIVREARLKQIVKEIKEQRPDILVSTGDLVDGQINKLEGLAELLQEIKPRYGKYAITGNHEFYAGLDQSIGFIKKAGFSVLRGQRLSINGILNIAGVDDRAGKPYGLFTDVSEKDLLSEFDHEKFTLLLKHRPLVDKNALGLFDLQLSGHTHKGQIFPFKLLTHLYYPVVAGHSSLSEHSHLYVSRGTGTWGPPIRFLSTPEVTVIELVSKE
jgi:predicted MPP superfamily phosphohydrolase